MIVSDTKWHPSLKDTGRSKYRALAQAIREGIVSKQLKEGEQLPPVRELAYRIGVTPGTVARAYAVLTDEGRLEAGVGRGTFVAPLDVGRPPPLTEIPLMYDTHTDAVPGRTSLISPVMPDCGQGEVMRAQMRMLADHLPADALMDYPSRASDRRSREAEFARLDGTPTGPFTVDDIVVSNGGQNAIALILQTILHGNHPVIAMDELGFGGIRTVGASLRAPVIGVPWDQEGPDANVLEHLIKTQGVQVFGTSSEVNNPTVRSTSTRRRKEIAALAQRYGVHVIDDECFWRRPTLRNGPSYRALLPDLGWYISSPSKAITPALRIGFSVAPEGWAANLVRTATYNFFGVNRMVSDHYAATIMHPDMPDIIARIEDRVAQDVRGAVNVLGGHRINWAEDVPFIWLELPEGWRAGAFKQAAEAEGVLLKSAEDFTLREGRSVQAIRIAVNGHYDHDRFLGAMQTLRRLLDAPQGQMSA